MKAYRLALAIPTYNRPEILNENLLALWDEIHALNVGVYISDDSPNDQTAQMVAALQQKSPNIYYQRNQPALGHDRNCVEVLGMPNAEYIWYLGDANAIQKGGMEEVLKLIAKQPVDFVAVNSNARAFSMPDGMYNNGNVLLQELGWHLTMTGVTVYKADIQQWLPKLNLSNCPNFPQLALIFEKFAAQSCQLYWLDHAWVIGNPKKVSYWSNAVLDTFLRDWCLTILGLPDTYKSTAKHAAIRMHGDRSGLFSPMKFLKYRSRGVYSYVVFRRYYPYIRMNTGLPVLYLALVAVLPKPLLFFLKNKI